MTLGPATHRWLRMLAEDMRDHWREFAKTPEAMQRLEIIEAAAVELHSRMPCTCGNSATKDSPTQRDPDPRCPRHCKPAPTPAPPKPTKITAGF